MNASRMNATHSPHNATWGNRSNANSTHGLRSGGHRVSADTSQALLALLFFLAVVALMLVLRLLRSALAGGKADLRSCKVMSLMEQGVLGLKADTRPVLLEEVLVAQDAHAAGRPVRRSRSSAVSPV